MVVLMILGNFHYHVLDETRLPSRRNRRFSETGSDLEIFLKMFEYLFFLLYMVVLMILGNFHYHVLSEIRLPSWRNWRLTVNEKVVKNAR